MLRSVHHHITRLRSAMLADTILYATAGPLNDFHWGQMRKRFFGKKSQTDLDRIWSTDRGYQGVSARCFSRSENSPNSHKIKFSPNFPKFLSQKWAEIFYEILGLVGGKGPRKINIKIKGQPQIFGWGGPNFQIGSHALPPGGETEVGQPNFVLLLDTILP